jgi:signal transduction histidine kinase/ActR/RegA family two-component response regulator
MTSGVSPELVAAADALSDATLLLARGGAILHANAAARDALALDESASELAPLTLEPALTSEYLSRCARTTQVLPGAFAVQRRTSSPVEYVCRASLISPPGSGSALLMLRFWPKEGNTAFIAINQKVSELTHEVLRRRSAEEALRRSEAALRDRAIEAEGVNRIKDEFVATLSHELRTPLNAILGWARLLREGQLSEERRARALETIERNAVSQGQLIEELLDVSRIVTGNLRLNVQQLDPIAAVQAALDTVRPAADAKGVRLQAVLDPQAGAISGDPDRLQQICWNLLSNAVKFTPKGGWVRVVLERIASSIEITVSDSGAGIHPDFLPHVFERFRQQDASRQRAVGGLGLGLAIVKSLAELHGGTVRAESAGEGTGATFVIRLPRAPVRVAVDPATSALSAPLAARGGADCPPALEGLRVVVVDDEADSLALLEVTLEQCGAKVKTARSASEGLECVQSFRPDVLISDIGMPGEDGYALIRKVRQLSDGTGGRTPAVALTAYARAEDRTRALLAGFQSHVAKPVDTAELFAVIGSVIGGMGPRAAGSQ